jgi:hypothetical protein
MKMLLVLCFPFLLGLAAGQIDQVAPPAERATETAPLPGQGCCSSHGGECGCRYGRVVCCDGSLSPSCHCN